MKTYGPKPTYKDLPNYHRHGRRLRSSSLHGVKGCFVCGKEHNANDRYTREEVTAAIKNLKDRNPSALITVADLDHVQTMCADYNHPGSEQSAEDEAQWADDDEDDQILAFTGAVEE